MTRERFMRSDEATRIPRKSCVQRRRRRSRRFAISTSARYVIVAGTRNAKYESGSGTKPSQLASGVKGSTMPSATTASVVAVSVEIDNAE